MGEKEHLSLVMCGHVDAGKLIKSTYFVLVKRICRFLQPRVTGVFHFGSPTPIWAVWFSGVTSFCHALPLVNKSSLA